MASHDTRPHDTRHRAAIDAIVAGTEDANRYVLSWDEQVGDHRIHCSMPIATRMLARRIVHDLFLQDDNVTKVDFRSVS